MVLSGGGARGAYEFGALEVLAPALDASPEIIVGTSAGALGAAYLAANVQAGLEQAAQGGAQAWSEVERDLKPYYECFEVAVIDADRIAVKVQYPFQLVSGMHLAQHVQFQRVGLRGQLTELEIAQGCGNQQDGICPMGTRLKQLELVDDKVLAQARQVAGLGRRPARSLPSPRRASDYSP